jgi:serine phosphatase RsbU (regulator of sigma subunit)
MLVANKDLGAVAIIDAVLEHLSEFTNSAPFEDDVTLLVARRTGPAS